MDKWKDKQGFSCPGLLWIPGILAALAIPPWIALLLARTLEGPLRLAAIVVSGAYVLGFILFNKVYDVSGLYNLLGMVVCAGGLFFGALWGVCKLIGWIL